MAQRMQESTEILSEQQKRDFCAFLLKKYGIRIDPENELLPVYFLSYSSADLAAHAIKKATASIQEVAANFETMHQRNGPRQYQFASSAQAFWHGFGRWGAALLGIGCLAFGGWAISTYLERKDRQADQINYLLEKSATKRRMVNDSVSITVLTLLPAKSLKEAIAGKHYVYRQDCQCIEIPLYFQPVGKEGSHDIPRKNEP